VRNRLKPTPTQRDRFERQLAFILEHRENVPRFVPNVSKRSGLAISTLYNTLNGYAFNTHAIEAMYVHLSEALGYDKLIGVSLDKTGQHSANEHDQKILEVFTQLQEESQATRDASISFMLALRTYEQAYVTESATLAKLRDMYRTTGAKLSAETLTIIAERLGSGEAEPIEPNSLVPITFRPREEIMREILEQEAASSPVERSAGEERAIIGDAPGVNSPFLPNYVPPAAKPEYEPLPTPEPEPGNTDADYLEWLRTKNPTEYEAELHRRAALIKEIAITTTER
jgi:hypothetical protein